MSTNAIVYAFHGLPGTRKSTMSAALKKFLESQGRTVRIANNDDLRYEIAGVEYNHQTGVDPVVEKKVFRALLSISHKTLESGNVLIEDNTNLKMSKFKILREIADQHGAKIVHIFVDYDVDDCIEACRIRHEAGGRPIATKSIERMVSYGYMKNSRSKIERSNFLGENDEILEVSDLLEMCKIS